MIIRCCIHPSPKGINVDNPVQAAGAAWGWGKETLPPELRRSSIHFGVEEKGVVPLHSTRGYPHLSPSRMGEYNIR